MARDYRLIIAFILQWRRHLLLLVDSMAGPRDRDSTAGTRDRLSDVPPRRQDTQVVMMHVEAICRGTDLSRPSKESLAVNETTTELATRSGRTAQGRDAAAFSAGALTGAEGVHYATLMQIRNHSSRQLLRAIWFGQDIAPESVEMRMTDDSIDAWSIIWTIRSITASLSMGKAIVKIFEVCILFHGHL